MLIAKGRRPVESQNGRSPAESRRGIVFTARLDAEHQRPFGGREFGDGFESEESRRPVMAVGPLRGQQREDHVVALALEQGGKKRQHTPAIPVARIRGGCVGRETHVFLIEEICHTNREEDP